MPAYGAVLALATSRLKEAGTDTPQLDARLLLEAATGLTRTELVLQRESEMPPEQLLVYGSLIDRRVAREPVARILGVREFWGLPFRLSAGTLEPRPDSETLIETLLREVDDRRAPLRVLDLGTGTGCLLAALLHELPQATGLGIDKNPLAVETARANLAELDLEARAKVQQGHWAKGIDEVFDLVISNPPYIKTGDRLHLQPEVVQHDPALALFAGEDGLQAYRELAQCLPRLLVPGGLAVLELGEGQSEAVAGLMQASGLDVMEVKPDLGGVPRAMLLKQDKK